MTTFLLVFLLFFLPFVFWPFGISPFEAPKVIAAQIAIEILLVVSFLSTPIGLERFKRWIKSRMISFSLIAGLIILSLLGLVIFPSATNFFGNQFRLQGIFLLWHLLVFSLLSSRFNLDKVPKFIYLLSLILILATIPFLGGNENGRAVGLMGEPNALAASAIFILPFVFFKQKNFIKIIGVISALIIIFLSGSRSGLIAILIQFIFLFLTSKYSLKKGFIVSFVLLTLSLSLPIIEGGGWFENRAVIWQTALLTGLESPILGHGFGNIEHALHQTSITLNNMIQYQLVDSSHNIFLDFWVQGGFVGLFLFIVILIQAFKKLISQSKTLELTALIGLLTVMSFNPVSVVTLVGFWWIIGQGFLPSPISPPVNIRH